MRDNPPSSNSLTPKLTRADIKAAIALQQKNLPHIYGQKHYLWSRQFFESRNKMNLLCAANQIGKSTVAIKKNIEWACNKKLWPTLWPTAPRIFWYFYPSDRVASVEVEKKWIPDYLPQGEMKNHTAYGWRIEYGREVEAIHFNSGVTIYFKSYMSKVTTLQSSSVHMVTADEEMPEELYGELSARLTSTKGYFNQVFTATMGLPLWYQAMECVGQPEEKFKTAFKQNISLYDCRFFEDGSPGPWTDETIRERMDKCTSDAEIQKRVFGRFVKDEGRKYASFSPDRNIKKAEPLPGDWRIYAGVDIGSGGSTTSKTARSSGAIAFIAVNPDYTRGRIFKTWRGDGIETSAMDILNIYRRMKQGHILTNACYDYQSREFGLIASRNGEPFVSADKARHTGEQVINSLFRSGALTIDEDTTDNHKLVNELMTVPAGAKNRAFVDDLCFAGGTPIFTDRGILPIRCVTPNDMVLTRYGWQKVLRTSRRESFTRLFRLPSGIICTPRHKFLSDGEFKEIGSLENYEGLLRKSKWSFFWSLYQYQLNLTAASIAGTHEVKPGIFKYIIGLISKIASTVKVVCTGINGRKNTGTSPLSLLSITKITIHLITVLVILRALARSSICVIIHAKDIATRNIEEKIIYFWLKLDLSPKFGTPLKKGLNGIANILRDRWANTLQLKNWCALSVKPNSLRIRCRTLGPDSVLMRASPLIEEIQVSTTSGEHALFARKNSCPTNTRGQKDVLCRAAVKDVNEFVYNLAVENHPEYFAGGFLVANCDATRYSLLLIPWDFAQIAPELDLLKVDVRDPDTPHTSWTTDEWAAFEIRQRRKDARAYEPEWSAETEFDSEIAALNEDYGG